MLMFCDQHNGTKFRGCCPRKLNLRCLLTARPFGLLQVEISGLFIALLTSFSIVSCGFMYVTEL
jgi:hypothetical protein